MVKDEDSSSALLEWDDIVVDKEGKEYKIHFRIRRNEINMEIFEGNN